MGKHKLYISAMREREKELVTNLFLLCSSLVGRNEAVIAVQGWRGGLGNTNTLRILITP
jgi:hypothetical protein